MPAPSSSAASSSTPESPAKEVFKRKVRTESPTAQAGEATREGVSRSRCAGVEVAVGIETRGSVLVELLLLLQVGHDIVGLLRLDKQLSSLSRKGGSGCGPRIGELPCAMCRRPA